MILNLHTGYIQGKKNIIFGVLIKEVKLTIKEVFAFN